MSEEETANEPPLQKKKDQESIEYAVEVRNAFQLLAEAKHRGSPKSKKPPTIVTPIPKKRKAPPITIPRDTGNPDYSKIRHSIDGQTKQYEIKFTTAGLKLFPASYESHQTIINSLKANGTHYFTHPFEESKPKRFVLYGLNKYELPDVKDMLAEVNLHPTDVKYMFVKARKYEEQCNYIIYFNRADQMTLDKLKQTRAVNQTIVSWDHYRMKSNGLTCCRKCLGWGHGSLGCGLPAKCVVCAKAHIVGECPLIKIKIEGGHASVPPTLIKCGNCEENHTATYKNCPKRLQYIKSVADQRQLREAPRSLPPHKTTHTAPVFNTAAYNDAMMTTRPSYAHIANNQQQHQIPPPLPSNQPQQQCSNNNLYTMSDCQAMLDELFTALQACTNKQQQAKVIADYALKYLCKFP